MCKKMYIFVYLGPSGPRVYDVPIVIAEHYGTLFLRSDIAGAPPSDRSGDGAGSGWNPGCVAGKAAGEVVVQAFLEAMPLFELQTRQAPGDSSDLCQNWTTAAKEWCSPGVGGSWWAARGELFTRE